MPVIIDEAGVLWESNTICRYLAGKHQNTELLPHEPAARARVEQWMDWQATELNSSWSYAFTALVRKDPEFQDPHHIAAGVRGWNQKMGILEHRLATTKAYVAGPRFTLADIVIGLVRQPLADDADGAPRLPGHRWVLLNDTAQRPGFLKYGCNGLP